MTSCIGNQKARDICPGDSLFSMLFNVAAIRGQMTTSVRLWNALYTARPFVSRWRRNRRPCSAAGARSCFTAALPSGWTERSSECPPAEPPVPRQCRARWLCRPPRRGTRARHPLTLACVRVAGHQRGVRADASKKGWRIWAGSRCSGNLVRRSQSSRGAGRVPRRLLEP